MIIPGLELVNFRNFTNERVEFSPGVNVIWGMNGQGKTNLLEAVHVLSFTKSMRTGSERDLIKHGESYAYVKGGSFELRFSLSEKKAMLMEGVRVYNSKEWLGNLPVVFFGPQELNIVKNEPGVRRRFMDMALCQFSREYTRALYDYGRAREQKSKILKGYHEKPSLLDTLPEFNEKMAQNGETVISMRTKFTDNLSEKAAVYHGTISGGSEELSIKYITKRNLRELFEEYRERELQAGMPLAGPHRDDIGISINGSDARAFASQGQSKTAALSMKLAERDILEERLREIPIMLLDDVMSEMDSQRRSIILNSQGKGQCLITDCDPSRLKDMNAGNTIHVTDGKICM